MDKRALVLGLGKSGQAAANLLCDKGARVVAIDEAITPTLNKTAIPLRARGIEVHLAAHQLKDFAFDLVITSPGINPEQPLVRALKSRGIPILGELELGFQYCPCPIVAITGTNGKTTTTELVERVLRSGGKRTRVVGNIGYALCDAVRQKETLDVLAVEVSSFQLETIQTFRPRVSILLNITPDHLDRYDSMRAYAAAKARIFENQTAAEFAIVNAETMAQLSEFSFQITPQTLLFSDQGKGTALSFRAGAIWADTELGTDYHGRLLALEDTPLRGPHNAQNIMAALALAAIFEIPLKTARQAICTYQPLPHRCEFVATIDGVDFINDSKATNPDAVAKALQTFAQPIILIAGGRDKGLDFNILRSVLRGRVRHAVLIGESAQKLLKSWANVVECRVAANLDDAVVAAQMVARKGDCVLLSPACSSYDMFENFEKRGERFKAIVRQLVNQKLPTKGDTNSRKET